MDSAAVMEARTKAVRKGNKHWRKGGQPRSNKSSRTIDANDWRQSMSTSHAPNFAALIPVNATERYPVDARKLHAALGSQQDYSTWLGSRIRKYGFIKECDFRVFQRSVENPNGGRPPEDCVVTMDMAKHLAMVEQTPTGKLVRDYFIECERRAHEQDAPEVQAAKIAAMPKSAILMLAAQQADEIERLESRNAVLAPKAEALDVLSAGENSVTLQKAGNQVGLGRTTLVRLLKEKAIFQPNGQPYRRFLDAGYFEVKPTRIRKGDRDENYPQVFVTQPGLTWLAAKMRQWGYPPPVRHVESPVPVQLAIN